MTKGRRIFFPGLLMLVLSGCTVGPNYKRPVVTVPAEHRGLAPDLTTQQKQDASFADTKWDAVFQDEALQTLIREALTNNYDVKIAAARVLQAQAIAGITRADQLPSVSASYGLSNERIPPVRGDQTIHSAFIQASYLIDFWGQFRRGTEAARANLIATQYGQSAVRTSLISGVATSYYRLRQLDWQLEFAMKTVEADNEILRINIIKFKGRESAKSDVLQAQVLLQQAEASVISLKQQIEQTENLISVLLGRNPGPIVRGLPLKDQPHLASVPTGLPSSLLERRPDVLQSEQILVSSNANVGVAKAAFFPQLPLTAVFGAQSTSLSSFLEGPATTWALGGQVLQPIFQGGRLRSNYRLAWARRDEAELVYRRTVEQAFADVSNALVGYEQSRKFRVKLQEQSDTYRETARLAQVRFLGGVTSFIEVLVTQQQYFTSELDSAQAWQSEMQNYVQLYQALGGGWDR
jgi:outer membrane protein, multidrug efflux system